MRVLLWSVLVRKELSHKMKLSIYWCIFVQTFTYGHELWVVTERTRSQIQVADIGFLWRLAGLGFRDKAGSSAIQREFGVESLLLRNERSQLRWFGHLIRMPPAGRTLEVFRHVQLGGGPGTNPGLTGGVICPFWLGNTSVSARRSWRVLLYLLDLLPPCPDLG